MWVGEDGVVRTAPLADTSVALSDSLRTRIDGLSPDDAASLSLALDVRTEFDLGDYVAEDDESEYEGQFLPYEVRLVLPGKSELSVESLTEALEGIVPRWRLDITLALIDYLDTIVEG